MIPLFFVNECFNVFVLYINKNLTIEILSFVNITLK